MSRKRPIALSQDDCELPDEAVPPAQNSNRGPSHIRDEVVPIPLPAKRNYLKIITWNVNGLNSLVSSKLSVLTNLIANHDPDVLCFQVTASYVVQHIFCTEL